MADTDGAENSSGETGSVLPNESVCPNCGAAPGVGRSADRPREARLLRLAEETAGLGTFSLAPGADRLELSDAAARILGLTPGASLPLSGLATLVTGQEERTALLTAIDRCASEGVPFEQEHDVLLPDGTTRHLRTAAVADGGEAGAYGVCGLFHDVTPRRAAEREALQSGTRTRSLAEAVPVKVFMLLRHGGLAYVNEAFRAFAGADEETEGDALLFDRVHPEDADAFRSEWMAARREERPFAREVRLRRADGAFRWHDLRAVPVLDDQGRVEAWYGAASDIDALKAAQARSRALSERLQSILGSVRDGLMSVDRHWTITFLNEGGERLLGVSRAELIGRNLWEVFPHTRGSPFHRRMSKAMETGEYARFNHYAQITSSWFDNSVYPSDNGLTILFRDVTEERQTLERLRLMEAALATMDDMVIITEGSPIDSPGPRISYVNRGFTRVTGFTAQEAVGRSPRFLQGPDTDRATLDTIRAALERREPVRAEVKNYTRDGTPYWTELSITPLFDEDGRVTAFVSVQRDETERRRERAILEWQARMLEQAHDAVVVTDLSGIILYWNRSASELYGWATGEVLGRRLVDVIGPDATGFAVAEAAVREKGHWLGRMAHRTRSGPLVQVSSKWSLIDANDAARATIMIINTDITARLILDEEMHRVMRLEAIGQMTGGVAHDFNNILTILLGSADMTLAKAADRPDIVRLAAMAKSAAERGRELVRRLLAFARRQELAPAPTDVNALLFDLRSMLENAIERNVEIELDLAADLRLALVDPTALEHAVTNLCLNARDAVMPRGGRITIETRNKDFDGEATTGAVDLVTGEFVEISVSDDGCGMDERTLSRVLEPFFTTKGERGGTGLGLSMVYGFVKQSGGHLRIYSEPGRGTTVRLWLPVPEEGEPREIRREDPAAAPRGRETILLVEDDEAVRANVTQMVRSLGYEVVAASGAEEALQKLSERPDIALLFTDVVMPGSLDGPRLADAVHVERPGLPVLFTSGYAGAILGRSRGRDGSVQLLSKPYRVDELARALRRALDGQR